MKLCVNPVFGIIKLETKLHRTRFECALHREIINIQFVYLKKRDLLWHFTYIYYINSLACSIPATLLLCSLLVLRRRRRVRPTRHALTFRKHISKVIYCLLRQKLPHMRPIIDTTGGRASGYFSAVPPDMKPYTLAHHLLRSTIWHIYSNGREKFGKRLQLDNVLNFSSNPVYIKYTKTVEMVNMSFMFKGHNSAEHCLVKTWRSFGPLLYI